MVSRACGRRKGVRNLFKKVPDTFSSSFLLFDPSTGKWLSQDPTDFAGGDANLSRYVGNDPTDLVDPTGLAAGSVTFKVWSNANSGGTGWFWSATPAGNTSIVVPGTWGLGTPGQGFTITSAVGAYTPPPDYLANASDFANGFAHTITMGGTSLIHKALGTDHYVNHDSGWFAAGIYTGYAWQAAFSAAQLARAFGGANVVRTRCFVAGTQVLARIIHDCGNKDASESV